MTLKYVSYDTEKVKAVLEIELLLKVEQNLNFFHGTSPTA